MADLTGKRVLLLGAETELGAEIARALAEAGASLALVAAKNDPQAAFAVQRLARRLGAPVSQAIDATNEMAMRVMVRQVSKEMCGLDAIVCYETPWQPPSELAFNPAEFERALREHVSAAHLLLRHGGRELDRQGGGPLVLVGSSYWFGYMAKRDSPRSWVVQINRHNRPDKDVARRVVRAVRNRRPWLWPRILYWRTIGRAIRLVKGFTDYQYRS